MNRALFIVTEDRGSNIAQLCHELRRSGMASARCMTLHPSPGRLMGADIRLEHDGGAEFTSLLSAADVVHLVDVDPSSISLGDDTLEALLQGRRVYGHVRDADERVVGTLQALVERTGGQLFCERPSRAARLNAQLLPPFMPTWRGIYRPVPTGTRSRADLTRKAIVHVSSMLPLKRRPRLEDLVDRAELEAPSFVSVDTTVNERQARVMRRRRHALMSLGAWTDGIGRSGLEAMCQGIPLVGDTDGGSLEHYASLVGSAPPVHPASDLERVIGALDARADSDADSAEWVRRLLDPVRTIMPIVSAWERSSHERAE